MSNVKHMEEFKQAAEAVYKQLCTVLGCLGWIAASPLLGPPQLQDGALHLLHSC